MNAPLSDLKRGAEIVGFVALLLCIAFGAFSHFYAWVKCQYGIEVFRLINTETEDSFAIWEFVHHNQWILIVFPIVSVGAYISMRFSNVNFRIRISVIGLFAFIVLWYSWKCAYLGGKFLNM